MKNDKNDRTYTHLQNLFWKFWKIFVLTFNFLMTIFWWQWWDATEQDVRKNKTHRNSLKLKQKLVHTFDTQSISNKHLHIFFNKCLNGERSWIDNSSDKIQIQDIHDDRLISWIFSNWFVTSEDKIRFWNRFGTSENYFFSKPNFILKPWLIKLFLTQQIGGTQDTQKSEENVGHDGVRYDIR